MPADLTFGFATYRDFHGAAFTLQSLCVHHWDVLPRIEVLVIDQTEPDHPHARDLKDGVGKLTSRLANKRYVSFPSPKGTSPSRQRLFDLAESPTVLCVDSHVLLLPRSVQALLDYYDSHPKDSSLLHGILYMDDLANYHSHMERVWRGEMLGIWGMMWACSKCGQHFIVQGGRKPDKTSQALFFSSPIRERRAADAKPFARCKCGLEMPDIPYERHESKLLELGFKRPGESTKDKPYEIPGHGMGMFACRKETWDAVGGFPKELRGFGGEEIDIHETFERHGHKTLLLPGFRWWHRFGRPEGAPYPLAQLDKVRNYIIWFRRLGRDISEIWQHFGEEIPNKITRSQWDGLVRDIDAGRYQEFKIENRPNSEIVRQSRPAAPEAAATLDGLFEQVKATPRDLDKHLDTLRSFVEKCGPDAHATELSTRKESAIALLAGRPKKLVSYNTEEATPLFQRMREILKAEKTEPGKERSFTSSGAGPLEVSEIEPTDLLFVNTPHDGHTAAVLRTLLSRHLSKVRRFLVVHDTYGWGEKGGDGGEGLNFALRELVKADPRWQPVYFTAEQYGLTVLSCVESDHPEKPIHAWPPGYGPGTELKAILASLGIEPTANCSCNARALTMDYLGVEGCKEKFDEISGWLRDESPKWNWKDKITAAAKAVSTGLAFSLNPVDPYPSLVKEAIRRAEEKEKQGASAA